MTKATIVWPFTTLVSQSTFLHSDVQPCGTNQLPPLDVSMTSSFSVGWRHKTRTWKHCDGKVTIERRYFELTKNSSGSDVSAKIKVLSAGLSHKLVQRLWRNNWIMRWKLIVRLRSTQKTSDTDEINWTGPGKMLADNFFKLKSKKC